MEFLQRNVLGASFKDLPSNFVFFHRPVPFFLVLAFSYPLINSN